MKRAIFVYSLKKNLTNGALTGFKKIFEVKGSSALPPTGSIVPPGCLISNYGQLKQGVVTGVRKSEGIATVLVGTETSTEELRSYLIPEDWEETPNSWR